MYFVVSLISEKGTVLNNGCPVMAEKVLTWMQSINTNKQRHLLVQNIALPLYIRTKLHLFHKVSSVTSFIKNM